jgi:hypothetical protein
MIFRAITIVVLIAGLSACADSYVASPVADQEAKQLRPAEGRALLYVYWGEPGSFTHPGESFLLAGANCPDRYGKIDKSTLLPSQRRSYYPFFLNTYYVFDIPAAEVRVAPVDRNLVSFGLANEASVSLAPGDVRYVRIRYQHNYYVFWFSTYGSVGQVESQVARDDLKTSRLIQIIHCD